MELAQKHIKAANSLITDLRIRSEKLNGEKKATLDSWIDTFDNLYNYTARLQMQLNDTEEQLGKILLRYGECASKYKELEQRINVFEQISEIGMDEVLREYELKVQDILNK